MAIAFVNSVDLAGGQDGGTVTGVDMSGANFLVAFLTFYPPVGVVFSDNQSNTWSPLTEQDSPFGAGRIYYAENAIVSASQSFTVANTFCLASALILGFSGVKASSALDQENGFFENSASTTIQTGSITPSEDGCLLVYGAGDAADNGKDVISVDIGTLELHGAAAINQRAARGIGYQIQTTATARNPTFTYNGSTNFRTAAIASFKAATGGGGVVGSYFYRLVGGMDGA